MPVLSTKIAGVQIAAREQRAVDHARNVGAEGRDVGAEIGEGLHVQGEESSVGVERQLGVGDMIARLVVGDEALRARSDPADRSPQPARRPGDDAFLGIELALVAETAADIGRDDAQRALRDAELLGDRAADVVRRLRRAIEREPVGHRVDRGDRGARLDRRADQPVVDEVDRDDMRRRLERRAYRRFVAARRAKADVAGRFRVQLRRAGRLRGAAHR